MNKRISLSREQVDKLLEMCKDSFPEYSHIDFKAEHNEVWFSSKPDIHPDPHEYHWFELCTTELSRVMFTKLEKFNREDEELKNAHLQNAFQTGGEMLFFSFTEGIHIIDLLYKEHKKIKRWELIISKELKED